MYITDGTSIYQSTNEGATWTAMTSTGVSYAIQGIVGFGNDLFIVTGDGGSNKQLISYDLSATTFTTENLGSVFTGAFTGIFGLLKVHYLLVVNQQQQNTYGNQVHSQLISFLVTLKQLML